MRNLRSELFNREVAALFVALVGFYAVANVVLEPVGKPLEPLAEWLYAGFWVLRHHFVVGGFVTQLALVWSWFLVYSYLLAVLVGATYRRVRQHRATQ